MPGDVMLVPERQGQSSRRSRFGPGRPGEEPPSVEVEGVRTGRTQPAAPPVLLVLGDGVTVRLSGRQRLHAEPTGPGVYQHHQNPHSHFTLLALLEKFSIFSKAISAFLKIFLRIQI